jgi:hypothetical protein
MTASLVSAAASVGMWWGVSRVTGHREAWDSTEYFTLGLPCLAAVMLVLGYFAPTRAWRWAAIAGCGQVAAMFWLHPATGPLIVVGLLAHALVTLCMAAACLAGAALARRHRPGHAET